MTQRRVSRTARIIEGQLPLHAVSTIIPRGYVIPLDTFMVGISRFARRIGGVFPILTPRNTMRLTSEVTQGVGTFQVDELLSNIPIGSVISILGKEIQVVRDIDTVDRQISIERSEGLYSSYAARAQVYLHSVPITVNLSDTIAGAVTITVISQHLIVLGDQIEEIDDSTLPGAAIPHDVIGITIIDETTSPYQYTLTIDTGLRYAYQIGDTIYLRAYPAFKSEVIPLPSQPTIFGEDGVGPFLWDYTEGRLHDGIDDPDVFVAVRTISSAYFELDPMTIIDKNDVHLRVPIPASTFMFWDVNRGSLQLIGNYPVATPDENGDFVLSKDLVPWLAADSSWRATFETTAEVVIRIGFHIPEEESASPTIPSNYVWEPTLRTAYLEFTVTPGSIWPALITAPSYRYNRIEINFYSSDPTTQVTLRHWTQNGGRSTWVQYTSMARVNGDYTWGSSGLLLKPLFYNRDHLRLSQRLNSGSAMV